jgi:hypothetical protein
MMIINMPAPASNKNRDLVQHVIKWARKNRFIISHCEQIAGIVFALDSIKGKLFLLREKSGVLNSLILDLKKMRSCRLIKTYPSLQLYLRFSNKSGNIRLPIAGLAAELEPKVLSWQQLISTYIEK